jgi:hypothetical protein
MRRSREEEGEQLGEVARLSSSRREAPECESARLLNRYAGLRVHSIIHLMGVTLARLSLFDRELRREQ